MRARKRRLERRLDKSNYPENLEEPRFRPGNVQYEVASRGAGIRLEPIQLPPRERNPEYSRQPVPVELHVPEVY
jgi:hypothetical protein